MKKILFVAASIMMLGFISCEKDSVESYSEQIVGWWQYENQPTENKAYQWVFNFRDNGFVDTFDNSLYNKANKADVDNALDLKANIADVEAELDLKANKADVEESLRLKADAEFVEHLSISTNKSLKNKADSDHAHNYIYVGVEEPTDDSTILWVDPVNGLKYYDGSAWVNVPMVTS